jgi:hypothetical protein
LKELLKQDEKSRSKTRPELGEELHISWHRADVDAGNKLVRHVQ